MLLLAYGSTSTIFWSLDNDYEPMYIPDISVVDFLQRLYFENG